MTAVADSPGLPDRIVHVHIPKTAGTTLAQALRHALGERFAIYPRRNEMDFDPADYAGHRFFTGHIGDTVARGIGGDRITVLRDPVDRFLSTYYFFRQLHARGSDVSTKTTLAARYSLDQFVRITDEPDLELGLRKRMTWQIADSHRLNARQALVQTGISDDELVWRAVRNLRDYALVGLQSDMAALRARIERRYGVRLALGWVNATETRLPVTDLSPPTRDRIAGWIDLDMRLYDTWLGIRHAPLV